MRLASANAPIKQPAANAKHDAQNVCDPVVEIRAAIEAGLDEFNGAAEGDRADEHGEQAKAARARQREGECGEGAKVHQLVAPLRCRRLHGPEHRDGQGERHDYGEGDVEILTHSSGSIGPKSQGQV